MRRLLLTALLLSVSLPAAAPAAGYLFPDNGARALARAGAFAALPRDASAIYYNPAGLSDLEGTQLLLTGQLAIHDSRYQRVEVNDDGTVDTVGEPVTNAANPWVVPFFAASHRLPGRLTLALGGFGPSAFGTAEYPDPRNIAPDFFDGTYEEEEELDRRVQSIPELAPQRYSLIREFVVVAYPSLALAWAPTEWVSVGVTGQVVLAQTQFAQAIQALEEPGARNDIIAALEVNAAPVVTGIFGVQLRPLEHLVVGASVRPGFTLRSEGPLEITLSDYLTNLGYAAGEGSSAVMTLQFPTLARVGVAWEQGGWVAEADVVYEGWSVVQEFLIEPTVDVAGPVEVSLDQIVLPKEWNDAWSFRVGGTVDLKRAFGLLPLQVSAGYLHETSAIPDKTLSLDFISLTRDQVTFGVTWPFGNFAVTAAVGHIFQPMVEVRDSEVLRTVAVPVGGAQPGVVGNGDYESSYTQFVVGLEGRFGGAG